LKLLETVLYNIDIGYRREVGTNRESPL